MGCFFARESPPRVPFYHESRPVEKVPCCARPAPQARASTAVDTGDDDLMGALGVTENTVPGPSRRVHGSQGHQPRRHPAWRCRGTGRLPAEGLPIRVLCRPPAWQAATHSPLYTRARQGPTPQMATHHRHSPTHTHTHAHTDKSQLVERQVTEGDIANIVSAYRYASIQK